MVVRQYHVINHVCVPGKQFGFRFTLLFSVHAFPFKETQICSSLHTSLLPTCRSNQLSNSLPFGHHDSMSQDITSSISSELEQPGTASSVNTQCMCVFVCLCVCPVLCVCVHKSSVCGPVCVYMLCVCTNALGVSLLVIFLVRNI